MMFFMKLSHRLADVAYKTLYAEKSSPILLILTIYEIPNNNLITASGDVTMASCPASISMYSQSF